MSLKSISSTEDICTFLLFEKSTKKAYPSEFDRGYFYAIDKLITAIEKGEVELYD